MRWEADNDQSISKTSLFQLQQWFSLDVSHFFENRASKMGRTRFACMPYGFQPAVHNTGAAVPVEKLWEIDAVRNCCLSQKKWWFHHFRRGEAAGGPGWRGAFYTARVREWPSLDGWLLKNRRKWWMIVDFFTRNILLQTPRKVRIDSRNINVQWWLGATRNLRPWVSSTWLEPMAIRGIHDWFETETETETPICSTVSWNFQGSHCVTEVSNFAMRSGAADAWKAWMDYTTKCSAVLWLLLPVLTDSEGTWILDDRFQETEETSKNVHVFWKKRVYMRTYIYIHPYIHACMHTYIHTYIYIYYRAKLD